MELYMYIYMEYVYKQLREHQHIISDDQKGGYMFVMIVLELIPFDHPMELHLHNPIPHLHQ